MTIEIANIYDAEIQDGLQTAIAKNIVTCSASIKSFKQVGMTDLTASNQKMVETACANANPNQIDLYYLETILVSTGWNKNDDVFLPDETWAARHTPEDKQFNYMHDDEFIIGHITGSYVEDFDGNLIPEGTPAGDIPTDFNIVTPAVIYSRWSNPERQAMMDEIIADIIDGGDKWKVSMECIFPAFDYAAINMATGEQIIIPRNETSASLSKHLRAYGGEGTYSDYRLGRAIRRETFSGKGLVDTPANERSLIKKQADSTVASKTIIAVPENIVWQPYSQTASSTSAYTWGGSAEVITTTFTDIESQEKKMTENSQEKLIASLEAQLKETNEKLASVTADVEKKQANEAKAQLDSHNKVVAEKDDKIKDLEGTIATLKADVAEKTKATEEADKAVKEAEATIETLEKEKTAASRKAELISAGADETYAESLVEKWSDVDAEKFADVVALVKEKAETAAKFDKEEMDKKKKKDKEGYKEDESKASDDDDASALDDAELEDSSAALNSDDDNEDGKAEELHKTLASYFDKNCK